MTSVDMMTAGDGADYEDLVRSDPRHLWYASLDYRRLLEAVVEAEPAYLAARRQGRLIGALPAFVRRAQSGVVVNSLPFYGSHGGVLLASDLTPDDRRTVSAALLREFTALCRQESAVSSTVVASPLDPDPETYRRDLRPTHLDQRIGQVTDLSGLDSGRLDEALLGRFHTKTRNMVRKGLKAECAWRWSREAADLRALYALHAENMRAMGATPKPPAFFERIPAVVSPDRYRVYLAEGEGGLWAGLLLFYFNATVEYFTPAVRVGRRSTQALSGLIFRAMKDAVAEGYSRWNWGGTWGTQDSLYHFKSRWGAADMPYQYFVCLHRGMGPLRDIGKERLLADYRFFYVVPFSALEAAP